MMKIKKNKQQSRTVTYNKTFRCKMLLRLGFGTCVINVIKQLKKGNIDMLQKVPAKHQERHNRLMIIPYAKIASQKALTQ